MRDQLGVPRFDSGEKCVYVPVADSDRLAEEVVT